MTGMKNHRERVPHPFGFQRLGSLTLQYICVHQWFLRFRSNTVAARAATVGVLLAAPQLATHTASLRSCAASFPQHCFCQCSSALVSGAFELRAAPRVTHSTSNARGDSRPDYAATYNIPSSPHHSASRNRRDRDASGVPSCCSKPPRNDSTYGSHRNQHRSNAPPPGIRK
jgi:hypothetical protein